MPSVEWMHGLWAAVAALFWKLWDTQSAKLRRLEQEHAALTQKVTRLDTLQEGVATAIVHLQEDLKDNTAETRKVGEAIVRIETLLGAAIGKEIKHD